ncbi:unnamed protein product [Caenorhabditis nigoni]
MSDDPPRRSMVGAPPSARRARGGNTPAQAAATPSRSSARASKRVKKEEPEEEEEYKNSDQEKSEEEESENSEDEVAAPTKKTPAGKSKKKRIPLTDYHLKKKKILARKAAREAEKEREAAEEPEEEPEKEPTPPPPRQPPSFSTYEPIQLMQDHIIRKLVEKDPEDYFSYPVTEEMAPDYREIIQTPMDLQTIREKIEDGLYPSLPAMKGDCDLIVSNALQYNQPTTVFYLAAKRLANLINYYFGEPYLRYLFHSLPSANQVPFELAGIRPLAPVPMDRPVNRRRAVVQDAMTKDDCLNSADVKVRDRLSANIPPKKMAKMGFLSEKNGTVVLNVLAGDQDPDDKQENSAPARRVTIGDIVGPLEEGTTGMIQMTEHRLYSQTPINYLNYGPFSSFAPMYDTTWSTMTKDDTDLFLRTYGDKANAVGAISMRNFVENCPDFAQAVEKKLNMATDGEHSKTMKAIEGMKEEEEMMINADLKDKSVLDLLDDVSSISNFGIDTGFLSDIRRRVLIPPPEPEPSEATETPVIPEYMQQMNHMNVQQQLNHIGQEIKDLVHLQEGRLCQPPPQMLVNVQEPGPIEQKLAESVQQHLAHQMETHTAPEAFVNDAAIHDAIGVNMDDGDDLFSEFFVTQ